MMAARVCNDLKMTENKSLKYPKYVPVNSVNLRGVVVK